MQSKDKNKDTRQKGKLEYKKPTLSVFGQVKELTCAGSGTMTENAGKDDQTIRFP
jgi:hypothetical protein